MHGRGKTGTLPEMRRAVVVFLFLTLCSQFGAKAQVPGAAALTRDPIRLTHPLGDSFLIPPMECRAPCPLVIVSHSRNMKAEDSMTRPHLLKMFERFSRAGMAVLVSGDAGGRSWGDQRALDYVVQLRQMAIQELPQVGNTYTLGYSMGGLPALLSAYRRLFPVSGVLLLDARVNLLDAWHGSDLKRKQEIAQAHGVTLDDPLPFGIDPLNDYRDTDSRRVPLFVAGSPEDQTVLFRHNGEMLFTRTLSRESKLFALSGPHLGASHFGDEVTEAMVNFVSRLEHLSRAAARKRPVEAVAPPGVSSLNR